MAHTTLALAYSICAATIVALAAQVSLPAPTGRYPVGLSIAELIDNDRTQPFAPSAEPRKLMVSVFYPITSGHEALIVEYMPPETARFEDVFLETTGLATPSGTFEKASLQLAQDSSKHDRSNCEERFPVVLFQPAEGTTRLFYSLIASTVASKGYTVVTIDIPYDVDVVEYPDGSMVLGDDSLFDGPDQDKDLADAVLAIQTRAEDAWFVLDSLSNVTLARSLVPNLPSTGLNTTHVAMFGHSLGGASTLTALSDDRILGGIDMEGSIFGPAVDTGTSKPFIIMAREGHFRNDSDPYNSWAATWPNLTGWKRNMLIEGTGHYDFSDYPALFETLYITPNATVAANIYLGTLNGYRTLEIVTTYVDAFLGFVIYGRSSSLLDGLSSEFPEVSFED